MPSNLATIVGGGKKSTNEIQENEAKITKNRKAKRNTRATTIYTVCNTNATTQNKKFVRQQKKRRLASTQYYATKRSREPAKKGRGHKKLQEYQLMAEKRSEIREKGTRIKNHQSHKPDEGTRKKQSSKRNTVGGEKVRKRQNVIQRT